MAPSIEAKILTKFRRGALTRRELRQALARLDRAEIARRQRRIRERRVRAAAGRECEQLLSTRCISLRGAPL